MPGNCVIDALIIVQCTVAANVNIDLSSIVIFHTSLVIFHIKVKINLNVQLLTILPTLI